MAAVIQHQKNLSLYDLHRSTGTAQAEMVTGLLGKPKQIPSKFLYDARGLELYEELRLHSDFYLTHAEIEILAEHSRDIARYLGSDIFVIEFGIGLPETTRKFLKALQTPLGYMVVDTSKDALLTSLQSLGKDFEDLNFVGVHADYTSAPQLPVPRLGQLKNVVFFPGAAIGAFAPRQASYFLAHTASLLNPGDAILVSADMAKDTNALMRAYNDTEGRSERFHKNILTRLNTDVRSHFDLDQFALQVWYDSEQSHLEMHLQSLTNQAVAIDAGFIKIHFQEAETIHTENAYKYTIDCFQNIAIRSGLWPKRVWVDPGRQMSLHLLTV